MKTLKFIDHPVKISVSQYDMLKTKLVNSLISNDAVLSVYQMGSVKHPGISDLDIICVFKNDSQCGENYRLDLSVDEKNILTHAIFGIEEQDLIKSMSYNLISNLKHLGGKDLGLEKEDISTNAEFRRQIALEYMVKMLITIDAQVRFKVIKLRAFLLLAKAIEFDLQLLNVKSGKLYDLVLQVIKFRSNWYTNKPSNKDVSHLVFSFNKELKLFLEKELFNSKLYLPLKIFTLPGNFTIQKDNTFSITHKGLVLPNQFSFLGKKYINLQFRLNSFFYRVPFDLPNDNSVHNQRFQFGKDLVIKNKEQYPHFIPLTTSLSVY